MDENEYRAVYKQMNPNRCYFEKLLLLRYGHCDQAEKLFLAEREAYACQSEKSQGLCLKLLEQLRSNARFSLQITQADGPLPHAKEIKVQAGGLFGLQQLLDNKNLTQTAVLNDEDAKFGEQSKQQTPIKNVCATVEQAITKYNDLNSIPYNEIVKSIINFKLPDRKRRKKRT